MPKKTVHKAAQSLTIKAENPKTRYIKVQSFPRKEKDVPELRLCGLWLEKAGFHADAYVSITTLDGLLIIRQAEQSPQ